MQTRRTRRAAAAEEGASLVDRPTTQNARNDHGSLPHPRLFPSPTRSLSRSSAPHCSNATNAGAGSPLPDDVSRGLGDSPTDRTESASLSQMLYANQKRTSHGSSSRSSRGKVYGARLSPKNVDNSILNEGGSRSSERIADDPLLSQEYTCFPGCQSIPAPGYKMSRCLADGCQRKPSKQKKTSKPSFSRQRISSAKLRWKELAWGILKERDVNSAEETRTNRIISNAGGASSIEIAVADPSSLNQEERIHVSNGCPGEQSSPAPSQKMSRSRNIGCQRKLPERKKASRSTLSRQRIRSAKLRWKDIASRILKERNGNSTQAASTDDMKEVHDYSEPMECTTSRGTQQKPMDQIQQGRVKKRTKSNLKSRQDGSLKHMKEWLSNMNIFQGAGKENDSLSREVFTMSEDQREAFVQNMVEICQSNKKIRMSLLQSVKVVIESGLMVSAAAGLLQEAPCEEAQNVLNAWEDLKQKTSTRLPTNFLHAVNQLHEKRDLSSNFNMIGEGINISMETNNRSWKFQFFSEDKSAADKSIFT